MEAVFAFGFGVILRLTGVLQTTAFTRGSDVGVCEALGNGLAEAPGTAGIDGCCGPARAPIGEMLLFPAPRGDFRGLRESGRRVSTDNSGDRARIKPHERAEAFLEETLSVPLVEGVGNAPSILLAGILATFQVDAHGVWKSRENGFRRRKGREELALGDFHIIVLVDTELRGSARRRRGGRRRGRR